MKYGMWLKQEGQGCDYTIGCGNLLVELGECASDDAAAEVAKRLILSDYTGDSQLRDARLVVLGETLPVGDWYSEEEQHERAEAEASTEQAEREELKRLKDKFKD